MQGNRCCAESKAAYQTSGRGKKRCQKNFVHCVVLCLVELPVSRHRRAMDAAISARRRASPLLSRPKPLRLR